MYIYFGMVPVLTKYRYGTLCLMYIYFGMVPVLTKYRYGTLCLMYIYFGMGSSTPETI
jgi:hypothetical protein